MMPVARGDTHRLQGPLLPERRPRYKKTRMPSIVSALSASQRSAEWGDERCNDDRAVVAAGEGLALVAEAQGPRYGGYWAPFGIDEGLSRLVETFARQPGSASERLISGLLAAHDAMCSLDAAYERARGGRSGLDAARAAADAVRPAAWAGVPSFAHFVGSVTACAVDAAGVWVAQVGACRAYALREGRPHLLLRDDTLASVLASSGTRHPDSERLARVVTNLLGSGTLEVRTVAVEAPAKLALVTAGVWRAGDAAVQQVLLAERRAALERVLERCAAAERTDATAVVLAVE